MNEKVEALIEKLELQPHPEGGYYRRTFESEYMVNTPYGERRAMTSIYYLLDKGSKSRWHRLKSFERWYFHSGDAVNIHLFDGEGFLTKQLGIGAGEEPVVDIPENTWFCAELTDASAADAFAFVSCTVSPGFEFSDFELASDLGERAPKALLDWGEFI